MKNAFVETGNVKRFHQALSALERRGATEACLMVVDGLPGLGKTTALHRWATQSGAVYIRAKKEWSPSWFLNDLLAQFRIAPAHAYQKKFAQGLEAMLSAQSALALQKRTFAVVIDEADHVSRSGRIMESIRDFSDMGDIVFVLVGMGKIRDNLTAFPQVASRIAQYVRFEHATPADVRAFYDTRCEVPVADDLVDFTHTVTGGFNREIVEAIATVERVGKRNAAGPDKPVRLAEMAGLPLVNDRRTGAPIVVPGAVMPGNATHQAAVMGAMANPFGGPATLDELAARLPIGRKQIATAAAKLIQRAYVERLEAGSYALTLTGRKALEEGAPLSSGPHRGKRKIAAYRDTLQQRAWAAMRLSARFTIGDIVTLAANAADRRPEQSLQRFFHRLRCAGYLVELPVRTRGAAGTSPGHKVFRLVRDTGEQSPRWIDRSRSFRDFNTREVFPCA